MLGHSVSYYLPREWAKTPLYAEKVIPLLDYYLSVNAPNADKLALAYYDIWNKYKNPADLTEESLINYIRDHGYGYIVDLLALSTESLQTLLFLLPLIHYLKDTKRGLELVLSLLQLNAKETKTKITLWHESLPVGEEDTFSIESNIDVASIDSSFFTKFDTFIKKYVYPSLTGLYVSYTVSGAHTLLPILTTMITVDLYGDMDKDSSDEGK